MRRIPLAGPSITEDDVALVADAVRTDWQENAGTFERRFEAAFAEYIGVPHAIALPSCTSALHLSLASLGVGPGDEVIVPDITWIASAAPITYVGATPVFVDIDLATWCISPAAVEAAITERTRAIIAVDLYGGMPDMTALCQITDHHGIPLIEDAAQAIGATYRERHAGSFGCIGVFSFHGSKTITTGEGGMLVTDDTALYERCLFLRNHGRPPGDRFFCNDEVAFKYRMSAMQAALGLGQLRRVEQITQKKHAIFRWYAEQLANFPLFTLNPTQPDTQNAYWMVTGIVDPHLGLTKHRLMHCLETRGIDSRPFFNPLTSLPAYSHIPDAAHARARNRVSYALAPWGINLPSGLQLTYDDVLYVCDTLRRVLSDIKSGHSY